MKRFASLWVLGLLLVIPVFAQPNLRDKWISVTSGPFTVYSDAKPGKTQAILLALEQLQAVISALSPSGTVNPRQTILYAFANRDAVAPYFSTPPRRDVVHMAEYGAGPSATHIVLNAAEAPSDVLPWVYRAYLSQELLHRFPQRPLWARSGLGHFYATLQVEKKGLVRIGRPDKSHLERLQRSNWIPLGQFFGVHRDSAIMRSGHSRGLFEAQAWLLTHYLMTATGEGERPARLFFAALDSGITAEEAIRQVFGLGLEDFERTLRGYIRGATMSYFTVTLDNLPFGSYEIEPIEVKEMSLRLGQHLVRSLSPPPIEAAEQHLRHLADDPRLGGDALATLAQLRHKSGRLGEAETLYERALIAKPRQAVSYLNYAELLAEVGAALETRRLVLESAIEVDPNLGPAWARLAETHQEDNGGESARYLERALELMPERGDLAFNLAMAHLRAGDATSARRIVTQHLRNPDQRETAADAKREIARYETVSASNQALKSGDIDSAVENLERALAEARDPAVRAQIQGSIDRLELQAERNTQIDNFNSAVALVNAGQLEEAKERLSALLPGVVDPALRTSIEDLLTRLSQNP